MSSCQQQLLSCLGSGKTVCFCPVCFFVSVSTEIIYDDFFLLNFVTVLAYFSENVFFNN